MKFRLSLIIAVFLLVVTPIVITGLVTMEAAENALIYRTAQGQAVEAQTRQIDRLRENIVYMLIIGTVVSLTGAGIFATGLAGSVNIIKTGLDGLSRDVNVVIPPLRGVLGEITASINRMAQVLRETRSHRDALLSSSPNGIITIDREGRIILFNPAISGLTGIRQELALGADYRSVGLDSRLVRLLTNVLNEGETVIAREETLLRPDLKSLAVAVSTSRLQNNEDEAMGALAILIDLREKRLLEAQVLHANRLAGLGELAAGVAHEIRNPLTAVKGFTQVLEEELAPGDARREYTGVITKEVERLERIVRGLLAFARPAQSKFQKENLSEIMDETLVLVDNGEFRRRIELHKEYEGEVWADVDRGQVKQVLLNLLINASQAIESKGVIRVRIARQGEWASISVSDSGSGIRQENFDKLFDPFFTTKEKGTGLGLAMVHQLVELHQGKVQVRSAVGQGTEFTVMLPLRQGGVGVG